ncbi:MAG: tetratricopeptide repeat protein [bacterium]
MAFTGKPGTLSAEELLGIIHTSSDSKTLKIISGDLVYYLHSENRRLVGTAREGQKGELARVLKSRGLLSSEAADLLTAEMKKPDLKNTVLDEAEGITDTQLQSARFHLAETIFFDFLALEKGLFEWRENVPEDMLRIDSSFSEWVASSFQNAALMSQFRDRFPDFDQRVFWVTPVNSLDLIPDISLEEIRLLSRYYPSITIRDFFKLGSDILPTLTENLILLEQKKLFTLQPPGQTKQPSSKPFTRALLTMLIDKLFEAQRLLGPNGELLEVLKTINHNLEHMPFAVAEPPVMPVEEIDGLTHLTGSLDGLLDLNGIEELNLQEEMESTMISPEIVVNPEPVKQSVRSQSQPPKRNVKAGVKRQPLKTESFENDASVFDELVKSKGELKPDSKREAEADRIVQESQKIDLNTMSMEERVEAKVSHRRFTSNVTMIYNRFFITSQTLFELLGTTPSSDKKAVHKAFVKTIELINPKGIKFQTLDKPVIEKAIILRDLLKHAYTTIMDDDKKQNYLDSLRKGRLDITENRERAMMLFNQGMDKVRKGRFDEARAIFMQASKLDPNSPVFYAVMEDIDKEEREGSAVKFFQAGILAFKQKNNYERAIQLIRKAISLRPLDPTYHLKLAEIQMLSGVYKAEAVETYQRALELDPGNQSLRLTIANLMMGLGRKQEAANAFQEMLRWNPDNNTIKKNLAELAKEGIKPEKSEQDKKKDKKDAVVNEEFE